MGDATDSRRVIDLTHGDTGFKAEIDLVSPGRKTGNRIISAEEIAAGAAAFNRQCKKLHWRYEVYAARVGGSARQFRRIRAGQNPYPPNLWRWADLLCQEHDRHPIPFRTQWKIAGDHLFPFTELRDCLALIGWDYGVISALAGLSLNEVTEIILGEMYVPMMFKEPIEHLARFHVMTPPPNEWWFDHRPVPPPRPKEWRP